MFPEQHVEVGLKVHSLKCLQDGLHYALVAADGDFFNQHLSFPSHLADLADGSSSL